MSDVIVNEAYIQANSNAIRAKNGSSARYSIAQQAAAIAALPGPSALVTKSITANGSYDPANDSADGYSAVTVNVPNSYAAADEGKVVSSGALVAQTARSSAITANGTYDTTNNNSVTVNVSGGGGGGGSSGEVLFSEYKWQNSGGSMSIVKTHTVSKAGTYYLSAGGWVDSCSVKVNNSGIYHCSSGYAEFSYAEMQLAVGDVVDISVQASNRVAIHGLIIFLHE